MTSLTAHQGESHDTIGALDPELASMGYPNDRSQLWRIAYPMVPPNLRIECSPLVSHGSPSCLECFGSEMCASHSEIELIVSAEKFLHGLWG